MSGRPQPVGGWGCAGGGMGNTSMVDGVACGFVRLCWLWVPACACVCGWGHAVGFWGGAPWLWPAWPVPLLECGGVWVVVGGLVVICIVDASII